MVPHPARKLKALLLQLVEQHLHPFHLLGDLGGGDHPGVPIGENQPQFLECGRAGGALPDAGDRPQGLITLLDEQLQCRVTAVA